MEPLYPDQFSSVADLGAVKGMLPMNGKTAISTWHYQHSEEIWDMPWEFQYRLYITETNTFDTIEVSSTIDSTPTTTCVQTSTSTMGPRARSLAWRILEFCAFFWLDKNFFGTWQSSIIWVGRANESSSARSWLPCAPFRGGRLGLCPTDAQD